MGQKYPQKKKLILKKNFTGHHVLQTSCSYANVSRLSNVSRDPKKYLFSSYHEWYKWNKLFQTFSSHCEKRISFAADAAALGADVTRKYSTRLDQYGVDSD